MIDLLLKNGVTAKGDQVDIAIKGDKISAVEPSAAGHFNKAECKIAEDLGGALVAPAFSDPHFHMDATLSYGLPRVNQSGTLLEGIALWGELKQVMRAEDIVERALTYCDWAASQGILAIRSHVDICDDSLMAVDALVEVRDKIKDYIDLQLVAFPQDGYLRSPTAAANLTRALDKGVDVVGGIPHFERTMADGRASVTALCEIAEKRGLMVDMHCDESDDPHSRHIEQLIYETQRLGLQGRVAGSHLTSMHSMDNYYVSKLLPLMKEAGVAAIANPLINITLQGRHDTYPKRRGMTRVPEMRALGIDVGLGQDCVMDPWYGLGTADMLDVAFMAVHIGQMTADAAIRDCFDMVTIANAKIMNLQGWGKIESGAYANLVVLAASNPVEAIRLRPPRLMVVSKGNIIARTTSQSQLMITGRPAIIERRL